MLSGDGFLIGEHAEKLKQYKYHKHKKRAIKKSALLVKKHKLKTKGKTAEELIRGDRDSKLSSF